jgi:hypothetical protein
MLLPFRAGDNDKGEELKIDENVIGCVTAMKMRLRTLLYSRRSIAYAVGSYANSMKGVTCDTSAS